MAPVWPLYPTSGLIVQAIRFLPPSFLGRLGDTTKPENVLPPGIWRGDEPFARLGYSVAEIRQELLGEEGGVTYELGGLPQC